MEKRQCLAGSETAVTMMAGGKDDEGERLSKYSADAFPRLSGRCHILVNMRVTAKQIQYDRIHYN